MYRIGFDAKRLFNNFTGLGNYSRTLLQNLAAYYPENAYFLYTPKIRRHPETNFFLASPAYYVYEPRGPLRALWRSWGVKNQLRRHRIQLYHGLSHEIPFGIQASDTKSVTTIHDLIFKAYPGQYRWADRQIYDLKFGYACRHSDSIVAISEATKTDIIRYYNVPPEKISVVYQTCHERFMQERPNRELEEVCQKHGLPSSYMLYVGSVIERKNLLGIVKAIALLPESLRLPLAIVGKGGSYQQQVIDYARQNGLSKLLYFIFPEPAELPALYQQATLFLYPSYAEGFGIPVIEALYSRTPVITSNCSSLPEAAGPGSWLADPADPGHIAAGIERILTDDDFRIQMIQQGAAYAQRFHPKELTTQMMDLYRRLIG